MYSTEMMPLDLWLLAIMSSIGLIAILGGIAYLWIERFLFWADLNSLFDALSRSVKAVGREYRLYRLTRPVAIRRYY